eukprot:g11212.t1
MHGGWRWVATYGGFFVLIARASANALEGLSRERWVSLDSTYQDQTTDVATGAGGSMVYISGYQQGLPSADGSQSFEAIVMAYNSSGARQWVAEYGSSGEDLGNSVAADATGVYLAGTESVSEAGGVGDGDDTDAFVVKYNATGGVLWKTTWGSSEPDLGNGVAVDGGSGLVYVVGTTKGLMTSSGEGGDAGGGGGVAAGSGDVGPEEDITVAVNAGMSDVFLTCLGAADGEVQWTRQFGSSAVDVGNRVAVGPRGGVFVVGQLGDDADASLAGPRAFLAKYDYLGNAQFTARLNSSSAHYAVDLAPSVGSGGEGLVYMSGYTLGDSPSVFLARFEGSTGTQTWLTQLGEETGMPHLAQSVAVVEGGQYRGVESVATGSDAGAAADAPVVEGEEAGGDDARIVVVGYNTSVPSAESHSSTGFTAAADTDGNWVWHSASQKADRQTAIAISEGGGGGNSGHSDESFAYVIGTVAASEASPGNHLFLDIQRVVREVPERPSTPAPDTKSHGQSLSPEEVPDPAGGASSTTGLSQGSSLWLLIIAPIFVVLSCICLVSYVSKQCAIAFGTRPPPCEPIDSIEFGAGTRGRGMRSTRSFRRGKGSPSDWNDAGSVSPGSGDRRRRRNGGSGSCRGNGSGTTGRRSGAWPRSVAAAFRDRSRDGPPYRKLGGAREREKDGGRSSGDGHGQGRRVRKGSAGSSCPPSAESGEVELRQVTAQHRRETSAGGGGGGGRARGSSGGDDGGRGTLADFEEFSSSNTSGTAAAAGWDAFEDEPSFAGGDGREKVPHVTGKPRDDEPAQLYS